MSKEFWLKIAETIPCGQSQRISCCSKDNSMQVWHKLQAYEAYCYRCGRREREPHGMKSLSFIKQQQADLSWSQTGQCTLPDDMQPIPVEKRLWLLKAGVGSYLTKRYNLGYSPSMDRIILPTYMDGTLVYVQARALYPQQKPKYLNKSGTAVRSIITWSEPDTLLDEPILGMSTLVVTEDYLSTIRVGRLQCTASILGTTMTIERLSQIWQKYKSLIVWLDGDSAGKKGTREIMRQCDLLGMNLTVIRTPKDPKNYSNRDIKEILTQ